MYNDYSLYDPDKTAEENWAALRMVEWQGRRPWRTTKAGTYPKVLPKPSAHNLLPKATAFNVGWQDETKAYFTNLHVLIKGEPPAKYVKRCAQDRASFSLQTVQQVFEVATQPAEIKYYAFSDAADVDVGEGVSPYPVPNLSDRHGVSCFCVIGSEKEKVVFRQSYINLLNKYFPRADLELCEDRVVYKVNGENVGCVMAIRIAALPCEKMAREQGLISDIIDVIEVN